ncbi:hypothetical protein ZWY2020_033222 [Hordeum vulgare]|nr:hypothetical protein ZWY2020_033222 [Hordeum vulgare]
MPYKRQWRKALIGAYVSCGEGVEDGRVLFDALGSGRTAALWKSAIAGCAYLWGARRRFDEIPEKYFFTWDTMIAGSETWEAGPWGFPLEKV